MTVCLENQSESTENLLQTLKNSAYQMHQKLICKKLIVLICKQQTEDIMEVEFPITTATEKRKN